MGRYITNTIDKAEELTKWVSKLEGYFNKEIAGASIHTEVHLNEYNDFDRPKDPREFVGSVFYRLTFSDKAPKFLIEQDSEKWFMGVADIAHNRFSIGDGRAHAYIGGFVEPEALFHGRIGFKENSIDEYYLLTENKKKQIEDGFAKVKQYVGFYKTAVEKYQEVINVHNKAIDALLLGLEEIVS